MNKYCSLLMILSILSSVKTYGKISSKKNDNKVKNYAPHDFVYCENSPDCMNASFQNSVEPHFHQIPYGEPAPIAYGYPMSYGAPAQVAPHIHQIPYYEPAPVPVPTENSYHFNQLQFPSYTASPSVVEPQHCYSGCFAPNLGSSLHS